MPFLQAGFNARNFDTGIRGWTRNLGGNRGGFAPAELRRFGCGDYFWYGAGRLGKFLRWGEQVALGSHWGFDLPYAWQYGLPRSDIETKREYPFCRPAPETLAEARGDD